MRSIVPVDSQSLLHFLMEWYGEPTSPAASLDGIHRVPEALTHWHELSSRWVGGITSHNYAVPLLELKAEDGKVTFWIENQGTWIWSFDPDEQNYPVYEKDPSSDSTTWTPTGENLSSFLVHATVLEAILGSPAKKIAYRVSDEFLWAQDDARPLPFPAWNWPAPGSKIVIGEHWLALIHPSDASGTGHDVIMAATAPEHLSWTECETGITWLSHTQPPDDTTDEPLPW